LVTTHNPEIRYQVLGTENPESQSIRQIMNRNTTVPGTAQ